MIELIGYLGSALVVVSMLMSSVVKLRVINTIGSGIFAAYALMIQSYPTALMNVCLVAINIYNLVKLKQPERSYNLVKASRQDALPRYLLDYYWRDIQKFFPGFSEKSARGDQLYLVCCGGNPAGILLAEETEPGSLRVALDYSTPTYRDCSIGAYLYARLPAQGVHTLIFREETSQAHEAYLLKMGFVREEGAYIKRLAPLP